MSFADDSKLVGSLLTNTIYTCAGEVESAMPPATADVVRDKLVILVAPHLHVFKTLTRPKLGAVLHRAAIRMAHECRVNYFHRTDRYIYWPSEIAFLLTVIAEDYTTAGASALLRRSLEWNVEARENDIVMATVAPSYLYSSGSNELIVTVADVKRGLALMPKDEKGVLESKYLTIYRTNNKSKPPHDLVQPALRCLCEILNGQPMPLPGKIRRELRRTALLMNVSHNGR